VINTNLGKATTIFGVDIGPPGTLFNTQVMVTFTWDDLDDDGVVDGTSQKEYKLFVARDGTAITPQCDLNPDCDMELNRLTFQVDGLSEFALATLKMADAGGPYLVQAGSPLLLDGSGIDSGLLTYYWTAEVGSFDDPYVEDPYYIPGSEAGIFNLTLRVTDPDGLFDEDSTFVVVYNPEDGFVTGGGWFESLSGACQPVILDVCENNQTGKASFGFVSKYKKGATVPTGITEFQFDAGVLNFHSSKYDWLIVTGNEYARFKGTGKINGHGDYKFMLWAGDDEPDTFRIKIWQEIEDEVETVVYDNGFDQPISGGNIIVHK
jgi:hypothetical protein